MARDLHTFRVLHSRRRVCGRIPVGYGRRPPTVEGKVTSADGNPISGARVTLHSGNAAVTGISDANGAFKMTVARRGVFTVTAGAAGYSSLEGRVVEISDGANTLTLVLARETTSSLAVIGEVRTSSGASISTTTGSTATVNAQSAAAQGTTEVSNMLWSQMAMTPVIPFGGGNNATVSFAIRGPDPSETLVDIDGHTVNNGNTGDFDLSLLDPADLSSIQVIYGIAPSSLIGPNTIGGAVNIVTLQPTVTPQGLVRGFLGSYGTTGQTVQTTGTSGRWGYVASLHRATSDGTVNQTVVNSDGDAESVGSSFFGETLLSKLRYQLGNYGYLQVSVRNQAVNKDLSALLTNYTPPGCNCGEDDGDRLGISNVPGDVARLASGKLRIRRRDAVRSEHGQPARNRRPVQPPDVVRAAIGCRARRRDGSLPL